MIENITVGFIGAALALLIRELVEQYKRRSRRKGLAALCSKHLNHIRLDLTQHVKLKDGYAIFGETQYCEVGVGDFLYQLITSNIECFKNVNAINNTTTFFHHYMVNMGTVKARLETSDKRTTQLTEGTYNNLVQKLDRAIEELDDIAVTRQTTGTPTIL